MVNLVIDTDIGTDCDDEFALAYAMKNPQANIEAITTVQENLNTRGKIARKMARMTGNRAQIISGPNITDYKWWSGLEKEALSAQERMEVLPLLPFPKYTADTRLACIGPLTNIAKQLEINQSIKHVGQIYVMGSSLDSHNFFVDLDAFNKVSNQPWSVYQITKDVSRKIYFTKFELDAIRTNSLGRFLADSTLRWLNFTKRPYALMYDVLTVSAALGEDYVKFEQRDSNRFVSCGVDITLKDKLVELIRK
jgi:purine nucleosidase